MVAGPRYAVSSRSLEILVTCLPIPRGDDPSRACLPVRLRGGKGGKHGLADAIISTRFHLPVALQGHLAGTHVAGGRWQVASGRGGGQMFGCGMRDMVEVATMCHTRRSRCTTSVSIERSFRLSSFSLPVLSPGSGFALASCLLTMHKGAVVLLIIPVLRMFGSSARTGVNRRF
jgi:hypothetical protein